MRLSDLGEELNKDSQTSQNEKPLIHEVLLPAVAHHHRAQQLLLPLILNRTLSQRVFLMTGMIFFNSVCYTYECYSSSLFCHCIHY